MVLENIIGTLSMENECIECKSRLSRENVVSWLKTIAGFANSVGGDFYIGVEDKTNKLIGFDKSEADSERNFFNNQVNEHLVPRPQMKITFVPYKVRNKERYIINVRVDNSDVKPVILKMDGVPSIYMRRDGFTNGATYEEIIEMSIKSKDTQYDILFSDEEYIKKEFSKLQEFCKNHTGGKTLSDKTLESIGFFNEERMLANGAVFFKDDYEGKKTTIQCSLFSGLSKGSERIITINKFQGNITDTINYALDFIKQRMNHSIVKLGDGRNEIDSYPERAVFEGIINSIAHRDYYLDGTQIQIDMFKDRLEISSPGGLYRKNQIGKTYDLTGIISKRRNELISEVLVRCNVMEAAGTGFDKIAEEYAEVDDKHKPYIYSSSDHFTLVLPDLTYIDGVVDSSNPIVEYPPIPNGTKFDADVLSFCYYKACKASEIAEYLGISDSTYLRKSILENLVKEGYLIEGKLSRAKNYKTNTDVVRLN